MKSTEEEEENVSRSYLRDVSWKWMKDILFREIKKKTIEIARIIRVNPSSGILNFSDKILCTSMWRHCLSEDIVKGCIGGWNEFYGNSKKKKKKREESYRGEAKQGRRSDNRATVLSNLGFLRMDKPVELGSWLGTRVDFEARCKCSCGTMGNDRAMSSFMVTPPRSAKTESDLKEGGVLMRST